MSENNINIVEELLPRYCDGNVSAEEKRKLKFGFVNLKNIIKLLSRYN